MRTQPSEFENICKNLSYVEKERKRLDNASKEGSGMPEMSAAEIRLSCLENDGYETPELNDKLYLHFRGYRKIENLEPYTGCKAIWLESNGFAAIEGLDTLIELRCLYLSKNMISRIDGLFNLKLLSTLDLSNNRITVIENLSCCPCLQTLNISKNAISELENITHLQQCLALQTIDLMDNQLDGDIIPYITAVPALVSVALNGNPATRAPSFRKRLIAAMPRLCYLDRPVEELERLGAEAFVAGGADAEKIVRDRWRDEQRAKRLAEMEQFRTWQKQQQASRAKAIAEGSTAGAITEFTAEEQEQRRQEAEAAAQAERDMVGVGIRKLGEKYWAIEGRKGEDGYNFDALEAAVKEIKAEQQRVWSGGADEEPAQTGSNQPAAVVDFTSESQVGAAETADSAELRTPSSAPMVAVETASEEIIAYSDPSPSKSSVMSASSGQSPAKDPAAADFELDEPLQSNASVSDDPEMAGLSEAQQQRVREQRVADSLAIYKRQREMERNRTASGSSNQISLPSSANSSNQSYSGSNQASQSHTWAAPRPAAANAESANVDRPLYWSELMDLRLAEYVKKNMFRFDKVAEDMQAFASTGSLGIDAMNKREKIHTDACRLRWTQLDARQWSQVEDRPGSDEAESLPNYKVHVQVDALGKGHGAQPSFQAMASMTSSAVPTYLKVPSSFPSVADYGADDSEDEDASRQKLDGLD